MEEMRGLLATVNNEIWRKFKYIAWNKGISSNRLLADIIKQYIDDIEKEHGNIIIKK